MSRGPFHLPEHLERKIPAILEGLGFSVSHPAELADEVKELSDFFTSQSGRPTPWDSKGAQAAYLSYYLPIGFSRVQAVMAEGQRLGFFDGLRSFFDFGSGPGTAALALESIFESGICVERSRAAIDLHKKIARGKMKWSEAKPSLIDSNSVGSFSFVLNEMTNLPEWIYEFEALMILEPATKQDFSLFLKLREELLAHGYNIWAPCVHAGLCPLRGGRDWCHDRIDFEGPSWWESLEAELPMKNRTVTFSYLLARKTPPPKLQHPDSQILVRTVGDPLEERGKTRQLVCMNEERLFLSWLTRHGEPPQINRGELTLIEDFEQKGDEIRPKITLSPDIPQKK